MHLYTKEESKQEISNLVSKFEASINFYKSDNYKEANLEEEFIKPFLRYLNWNVSNEGILNPADREVIVRAKGRKLKEPDYLLQSNNRPFFYIEAKHPKYKLWNEMKYIWQAYSYAYSTQSSPIRKKVDFSLLTDFEEFRFFDCTFKATLRNVNNFVSIDWTYKDYILKFDELWNYFEKNNVFSGSLQKLYLNENRVNSNRIPPDKAFLSDLDDEKVGWRFLLAKDLRINNPLLSEDQITNAIQIVIDRFIFLKVLTDRSIEEDFLSEIITGLDKEILKKEKSAIEDSCNVLFSRINKTYNGSIFAEREILRKANFSNNVLIKILRDLLPENSRYNFAQIPVEILGTIYEQFLGKVVTFTPQSIKIKYKPELRKANGVFYTPVEIVDYIVTSTLDPVLKKIDSIKNLLDLKICDPACGSGTFLITAFERLIEKAASLAETKNIKKTALTRSDNFYYDSNGEIRLTSKLKKEILRSCIFGVDLDPQAIEVATTSLSLKALEDARHDELYAEVSLWNEQILPNLDTNLKCGNSLIDKNIFSKDNNFRIENENKILPFSWQESFPSVFSKGGFDVVIQNPPYIQQSMYANFSSTLKEYLLKHYCSSMGRLNTFGFFIQKGVDILKDDGYLGFIVPNTLLTQEYYSTIRLYLLNTCELKNIAVYDQLPFKDAVVENTSIIAKKGKFNSKSKVKIHKFTGLENFTESTLFQTSYMVSYKNQFSLISDENLISLKQKIESKSNKTLGQILNINQAIALKSDRAAQIYNKKVNKNYKPLLDGGDINKYSINWPGLYLKYDLETIHSCKREDIFLAEEKLMFRRVSERLIACYDDVQYYALNTIVVMTLQDNFFENINLKYVLGFFNSKIANFYYKNFLKSSKKVFSEIQARQVEQIPILIPDDKNKSMQEVIVSVTSLISENKRLDELTSETAKSNLKSKIETIERNIDTLFYKIYDLNKEDIEFIEKHQ